MFIYYSGYVVDYLRLNLGLDDYELNLFVSIRNRLYEI